MDLGISICKVQDCEQDVVVKKRQLCTRHYLQVRRHGHTFVTNRELRKIAIKENHAEVILTKGKVAIIDIEDVGNVQKYQWNYSSGYALTNMPNGKRVYLHRYLLNPPTDMVVDHINRDKLDNRRNNIRICKPSDNNYNKDFKNTSGFRGVTWNKRKRKWAAQTSGYGLGYFTNKIEAARAYNKKALEIYGEYARLNDA